MGGAFFNSIDKFKNLNVSNLPSILEDNSNAKEIADNFLASIGHKRDEYNNFSDTVFVQKVKDILKEEQETYYKVIKEKDLLLRNTNEIIKNTSGKAIICFALSLLYLLFSLFFDSCISYYNEILTFLSRTILKLPSVAMFLVGIKYLNLFNMYTEQKRNMEILDVYISKLNSNAVIANDMIKSQFDYLHLKEKNKKNANSLTLQKFLELIEEWIKKHISEKE